LQALIRHACENSDEENPNHQGNHFLKIAAGQQDNRKAPPSNTNKEIISIDSDDEDSDEDDEDNSDATNPEMENQEDSDNNDSDGSDKNNDTQNDQAMETDLTEADNDKNNKKKKEKENKKKTVTVNTEIETDADEEAAEKETTNNNKQKKKKKKVQVRTDNGSDKGNEDELSGAENEPEQPTINEPTLVDIHRDCRYNTIMTVPPSTDPWKAFAELLKKFLKLIQEQVSDKIHIST
jgi:serine-aspartate repeat-containing protein C/D/E